MTYITTKGSWILKDTYKGAQFDLLNLMKILFHTKTVNKFNDKNNV